MRRQIDHAISAASLLILATLLVTTVSCRKEQQVSISSAVGDDCIDIDPEPCADYQFYQEVVSDRFQMPCFNPNNRDEFIFIHQEELWRHTISRGESTKLKSDFRVASQPDWGRDGWITYANEEKDIYCIKEDGSNARRLLNTQDGLFPKFNHAGDLILYSTGYELRVMNIKAEVMSTFCVPYNETECRGWQACAISETGEIAAEYKPDDQGNYGIAIYDEEGNVLRVVYSITDFDIDDWILDIAFHPDNDRIYFTDGGGLKVIDLATEEVRILKNSCDQKQYLDISISPDGHRLLASRNSATITDCVLVESTEIVLMTADGGDEEVISFPE